MNSFVNIKCAKIKAEKRQSEHLELEEVAEDDSIDDPAMQFDELFVEFGVRPSRPIPHELLDENTVIREVSSDDQNVAPDHHLDIDSIIQLKLRLAEKQAAYDELSSKYVAMVVQKSVHQKLIAENSSLRRENERLRAQLDQAGMTSAAPNLMKPRRVSPSSSKSFLSFQGKNDASPPLIPFNSTNSFSNMMQSWRNRAA